MEFSEPARSALQMHARARAPARAAGIRSLMCSSRRRPVDGVPCARLSAVDRLGHPLAREVPRASSLQYQVPDQRLHGATPKRPGPLASSGLLCQYVLVV
jgi:hypothetical protein